MNILIVEDDITLASNIADTFASCVITNQITIISCPLDFIRQLDRVEIYDIVITDLILSPDTQDLWGYRVIEILREKGISIPIIVMSGRGDIDILRAAFHR
jgi:FixJ family two-component response regulator